MLLQDLHGGLLVELEGDHQIRLQVTCELTHHHDGITAEGALGGTQRLVRHDLTAAAVAAVDPPGMP